MDSCYYMVRVDLCAFLVVIYNSKKKEKDNTIQTTLSGESRGVSTGVSERGGGAILQKMEWTCFHREKKYSAYFRGFDTKIEVELLFSKDSKTEIAI